jgi:hypothetical protein
MARIRWSAGPLVLIALALPSSVASKDSRTNHHKGETARPAEPIKQQETQVPFSVWQSTEVALSEALQAIRQQYIAAEKQAETYKETWCSPSVLVNIALAVIGLGYLIFAGLQWTAINKQAKIANDTLAETRKAADAAEHQVRLTRENFIMENRAFVSAINIAPFHDSAPPGGPYNWRFRPIWRNSGSTPTNRLTLYVECEIRNTQLPRGYIFNNRIDAGTGFIPPKINMQGGYAPQATPITPQDLVDVQNGTQIYLFVGMGEVF